MSKKNILEFGTERLPSRFVFLGYMLLAVAVWRFVCVDWKGIFFLIVSVGLIFFKSGIIIDAENRMLKKYYGIFSYKKGEWKSIKQLTGLRLVKIREGQTMNVLSISRTDYYTIYKLYAKMPGRYIELMSGKKNDILSKAKIIADALQTPLNNNP